MNIKEEISRIKSLLSEEEDEFKEGNDFIKDYEKRIEEVKDLMPEILDFLRENLKNPKLISVESGNSSVHLGSTHWIDEEGKKKIGYSTDRILITISIFDGSFSYKREVIDTVRNILRNYFNIDVYRYGSVVDLEFINYAPEKF
jgi:hypothetical protein